MIAKELNDSYIHIHTNYFKMIIFVETCSVMYSKNEYLHVNNNFIYS
jgi:hypothetical protein